MLCIAHRGAMGHAPENTLAAMRRALDLGARFVEVDVYCVEGHLLVFHDDTLERTTNGRGKLMRQSYDYLRSLDAGEGERIPTLDEVCDLIQGRAGLNIELKGPGTAVPVVRFIQRKHAQGWLKDAFLVSAFNRTLLREVRALDADIRLGLLICPRARQPVVIPEDLDYYAVNVCAERVDAALVRRAHGHGLKIYVYTVNGAEDIIRLEALGVDGVFTNYPERVIERYAQSDTLAWG